MGWQDDLKKKLSGPGLSPEDARAAAARDEAEHNAGLEAAASVMQGIRRVLDEAHATIVKARPNLAGSVGVQTGSKGLGFDYLGKPLVEARRDGASVIITTSGGEIRAMYRGDGQFTIDGMLPMSPEELAAFVGRLIAEQVK